MKLYFSNPEKKIGADALFGYILAIIPISIFIINIVIYGYNKELNNVIAVFTVVLSVYLCYVYRFNLGLFLVMIFIAYTNYSVAVGVYLFPEIRPHDLYRQFTGVDLYGKTILCTMIFESLLILLSSKVIKEPHSVETKNNEKHDKYEYNNIIAWGALAVYAIIFFSVFRFSSSGGRANTSAFNEYRIIVAIIGCYYSGKKNVFKYAWTILIGITSSMVLLGGNRANMFGSMILLLFFWYSDFFSYKRMILILPSAVILLSAVGFARGDFRFSVELFVDAAKTLSKEKLTYEGAIYGYMTSLATMSMVNDCSFAEKVDLFVRHITYIFTVGQAGSKNPELTFWSRERYVHYFGYISPSYFFLWFKYLGPVIYTLLVNTYISLYKKYIQISKLDTFFAKLKYILSLYFICTVTRWYTYGPLGLLRGAFVCSFVFFIVYWIDNFIKGVSK